jgi:hypothetical protein
VNALANSIEICQLQPADPADKKGRESNRHGVLFQIRHGMNNYLPASHQ